MHSLALQGDTKCTSATALLSFCIHNVDGFFYVFQLPELSQFAVGLMHIQLLHTSASLAINENWDPDVRDDMEMMLNRIVPEDVPFRHSCEGPDDMVINLLFSTRSEYY